MADFTVDDLVRAFDKASDDIKREVGDLIQRTAVATKAQVQSAFPIGPTGRLHDQVFLARPRDGFAVTSSGFPIPAARVRATAPHVHIWELGTRQRRDPTRGNANRGRSPRHGKIFEAIAVTQRSIMLAQATALLSRDRELV